MYSHDSNILRATPSLYFTHHQRTFAYFARGILERRLAAPLKNAARDASMYAFTEGRNCPATKIFTDNEFGADNASIVLGKS